MQDVGREGCGAGGDGLIWELCTLPLFCCEHKSTLKNNILIRERERDVRSQKKDTSHSRSEGFICVLSSQGVSGRCLMGH